MTLDPETDLKLERVVDAPRDLLWLCWTTPEHIKNFFIPAPHKVTECDLDLRVGGRFNTVFEVDGQRMDNRAYFLKSIRGTSWSLPMAILRAGSRLKSRL